MIIQISIFKKDTEKDKCFLVIYGERLNTFHFPQKKLAREFSKFISREVSNRIQSADKVTIQDLSSGLDYLCHAYYHEERDFIASMITDKNYLPWIAYIILEKTLKLFFEKYDIDGYNNLNRDLTLKDSNVEKYLDQYQDYKNADQVEKIKSDVEEIRDIMIKNIDDILQRGEKIDQIITKTEDLSKLSRQFYKKSQKLNRCCTLL